MLAGLGESGNLGLVHSCERANVWGDSKPNGNLGNLAFLPNNGYRAPKRGLSSVLPKMPATGPEAPKQ